MRSYVSKSISAFHDSNHEEILHELIQANHGFAIQDNQKRAWEVEISLLKKQLPKDLNGKVVFEYTIPRMGKRADCVLLIGACVFILEFKVGASSFDSSAVDQVHDYALDLKNFHRRKILVTHVRVRCFLI